MKNEFESFSRGIVPCTASLNHSGLGLIKILWCLLPYVFINDVCFFFFSIKMHIMSNILSFCLIKMWLCCVTQTYAGRSDSVPLYGSEIVFPLWFCKVERQIKPIKRFGGLKSSFTNDEHCKSSHWSFTGGSSVISTSINDHKVALLWSVALIQTVSHSFSVFREKAQRR